MALFTLLGRDVDVNESRQAESLREVIAFIVLATVFVAARFIAKRCSKASVGLDDWTIVLGLVCLIRFQPRRSFLSLLAYSKFRFLDFHLGYLCSGCVRYQTLRSRTLQDSSN